MKDIEIHILFKNLKDGNNEILEEIYNKYQKLVYSIAFSIIKNKESAEDIMQNVFIKLFKTKKENLPSDYEYSWLYSVTKNETINYIKKNKETIDISEIYDISSTDNSLDEIIDKDFYNRIISKLNSRDKEIVSLKIIGDRNFREISELLKLPVGTVKWRYYNAVSNLKILMSNLGMFIICLTISIKTTFKVEENYDFGKYKSQTIKYTNVLNENSKAEINKEVEEIEISEDEEKGIPQAENQDYNKNKIEYEESSMRENVTKTESVKIENIIEDYNQNDSIETKEDTIQEYENIDKKSVNTIFDNVLYLGTEIFLITTVISYIFFIKNKRKVVNNLSKNKKRRK